jgi:hypothetical protein
VRVSKAVEHVLGVNEDPRTQAQHLQVISMPASHAQSGFLLLASAITLQRKGTLHFDAVALSLLPWL